MNWPALNRYILDKGLPKFRSTQLFGAYFAELASSWEEITTFPKALREELQSQFAWSTVEIVNKQETDDVLKIIFRLHDGQEIESVLMKHDDDRRTICISCQVGCPMACTFCATGTMGLKRQLTAYEIYDQVIYFARILKIRNEKITNIVFMGMGEPMLNFDAVKEAILTLHDGQGFNLGWRHFTISTCGLVAGIKRQMVELPQVNLAVSLHAADDEVRTRIMPVNKGFPLATLMPACAEYVETTNRKIFFEYLMLKGINDSPLMARKLVSLMKKNPLYHVNLIRYHYTGYIDPRTKVEYVCSDRRAIDQFKLILEKADVSVTVRRSFGEEIDAACGQLVRKSTSQKK